VDQLDVPFLAPAQKVPAGQFRALVAANRFRLSPVLAGIGVWGKGSAFGDDPNFSRDIRRGHPGF